jgi:phenylalanyl-tRNA synthetase beta subunit
LPDVKILSEKLGIHSFELEEIEENNGDFLIDLDILPNRSSDSYSYNGIAQEISALFSLPLKNNIKEFKGYENIKIEDYLELEVETKEVKRATKRIALDVKIKESPK